jgi:hypothetical protein
MKSAAFQRADEEPTMRQTMCLHFNAHEHGTVQVDGLVFDSLFEEDQEQDERRPNEDVFCALVRCY